MGSVAVSDVASDLTRFPHGMMVMNHHHESSPAGSDRHHHSSADSDSHPSRRSSQHHPASAADVHASSTPDPPDRPQPTAPIDVPGARRRAPCPTSSEEGNSDDEAEDATPRRPAEEEQTTQHSREPAAEHQSSPPSPQLRPTMRSEMSLNSRSVSPTKIVVRDLNHIQSFASEEMLTRSRHGSRRSLRGRIEGAQQYEISSMPVTDIIEMVAGLLTKITTTNDRPNQHDHLQRHLPSGEGTGSATQMQMQSVLSFHGRNIPSITILSYLSRIHRYCPTTYEVFLSLLVYFDRMTEKINSGTLQSFRSIEQAFGGIKSESDASKIQTPPGSGSVPPQDDAQTHSAEQEASLVDSDDEQEEEEKPTGHVFVVDSYNIHRLVIAGVTCASKFFSDVFYTNSRYAKVRRHVD
jgi:PHO85 cyclin-6/7